MKKILFVVIVAQMGILLATPTVTDVVAKQRYPWNGLVDITCKVTGIEKSSPYKFFIDAVQVDEGITNKISTFWVVQNGTKQSNFVVAANDVYHLIWNSKADLGSTYCTNMIVRVTIDCEKVQLWKDGPYWATTNIGAENPEDYGYYFWWGDTVGYKRENNKWVASDGSNSNFSFEGCNTPTYDKSISTLQSEGWITSKGFLAPEHDAANVQWGDGWRMPTSDELYGLSYNCDWTWTTMNGVTGFILRGRGAFASNSIFLPDTGYGFDTTLMGASFYWWSSDPYSNPYLDFDRYAQYYYYDPVRHYDRIDYRARCFGHTIRPVFVLTK